MKALRGELRHNEPMAAHVSWRAGGAAALWYRPADQRDLGAFLAQHSGERLALGLGSNLLVRDGGYPGAVVSLYEVFADIESVGEGRLRVGAGVHCAALAKHCAKAGLVGATFFGGIPGSLGGALAMNAGAWGGETWPVVRRVTVLTGVGELQEREAGEFSYGYRELTMPQPGMIFIAAELELGTDGDPAGLQAELRDMLAQRRATQPVGQPSCGSVFRNPPGAHAADLIERAGLKGRSRGQAQISPKHANFIINLGGASAADIEGLIQETQATVAQKFGVDLQTEVRIVGVAA